MKTLNQLRKHLLAPLDEQIGLKDNAPGLTAAFKEAKDQAPCSLTVCRRLAKQKSALLIAGCAEGVDGGEG